MFRLQRVNDDVIDSHTEKYSYALVDDLRREYVSEMRTTEYLIADG